LAVSGKKEALINRLVDDIKESGSTPAESPEKKSRKRKLADESDRFAAAITLCNLKCSDNDRKGRKRAKPLARWWA